jgi:hypothetical protein
VDNYYLEVIGLVLPLITGIFMILYLLATRNDYSGLPPLKWILLILIGFILIAQIPQPEINEENLVIEEENTITTSGINPILTTTTPNNIPQQTGNQQNFIPEPGLLKFLTLFLSEFRNLFLVGILILTIVFLLILRRQSKLEEKNTNEIEEFQVLIPEKDYKATTILECYYQASTSLEERGANDSLSFTPPEFTEDVRNKKLCPDSSILNLTDLFEEAKFSNHQISEDNVKNAKELAQDIIFATEYLSKAKELEDLVSEEE